MKAAHPFHEQNNIHDVARRALRVAKVKREPKISAGWTSADWQAIRKEAAKIAGRRPLE